MLYRRIYLDNTSDIFALNAWMLLLRLGLTVNDWIELTRSADSVGELPRPLVHIYATGRFEPGGRVKIKVTGTAGVLPVRFWYSDAVLVQPRPTVFGNWYLAPPLTGPFSLGIMPDNNVAVYEADVPPSPPGPYTIFLQALSGSKLTNMSRVDIQ